jgi:5,10-methylenetetrahydrofolate reductase
MTKVSDAYAESRAPVFLCDFSPPRGLDAAALEDSRGLDADFICVAYSPGKAVRVDSAALAAVIKRETGRDVVFNLATRDMNRLAIQNHLLGAQLLGLQNVLVIQGDPLSERERERLKPVDDFSGSQLIAAINELNQGKDYRGLALRGPTDLCAGTAIDLGRGVEREARLARRRVFAGAQFVVTQPIFSTSQRDAFLAAYAAVAGEELRLPVFWGLQVLAQGGITFSNVPAESKDQVERGRDGAELALELLAEFTAAGVHGVYLVPPILRGGLRDYAAAQRVLSAARAAA